MKVSNNFNVANIYKEQVKKAKNNDSVDFGSLLNGPDKLGGVSALNKFNGAVPSVGSINKSEGNVSFAGAEKSQSAVMTKEESVRFAAKVVAEAPDIREDKVAHLKALVDAGKYNVSPEAVAEKLWASGVITKVW